MNISLFIIVSAIFVVLNTPASSYDLKVDEELNPQWIQFKSQFNKKYNGMTEIARRIVWEQNLRYIQKHNFEYDLGQHTYFLGVNEYADLTNEEFRKMFLSLKKSHHNSSITFLPPLNMEKLPTKVDWRIKGYVTPVKNQGGCGSCWAFSTTGSLEGQLFRKTKKLVSFSEQQLVDCSKRFKNNGCNGGLMDNAFEYIKKFGIEKEQDYPYVAKEGFCRYKKSKVAGHVKGYVDIESENEASLAKATATVGPISVAIDASHPSFQLYKGGVYNENMCSSTALDHGVLVVGYGTILNNKYWLVKNSWGPKWGLQGYIRMSKDKNNQCGIATMASYPLV